MDRDNSGFLDHNEFAAGLASFGMDVSHEQVAGMLLLLDTDGSGKVDEKEFSIWAMQQTQQSLRDSGVAQ